MNDLFIQQIRLKPDVTVGDRLQNLFPLELRNSITVFYWRKWCWEIHIT